MGIVYVTIKKEDISYEDYQTLKEKILSEYPEPEYEVSVRFEE